MILEEETFEKYGYRPSELKRMSNKKILARCEYCNNIYSAVKCSISKILDKNQKIACKNCRSIKQGEIIGNRWTEEEINILKEQYGKIKNKNININRSKSSILGMAHTLKLKGNKRLSKKDYTLNHSFFKTPNLLNSYYAGLIASDGCLSDSKNSRCINLDMCDKHIVEQFKNDIEYTGPFTTHTHIKYKTHYKVNMYSEQLFDDLVEKWNITPRKSLTLQPPNLTGDLAKAYILGYFDGDGCVKASKTQCLCIVFSSGALNILEWIKDILQINNKISSYNRKNYNTEYALELGGQGAYDTMQNLYSLGTPYLFRKKERVDSMRYKYNKETI
jgi:hypothetical protein